MAISIYRAAADGLSRQRWDFNIGLVFGGSEASLRLIRYAIERRAQPKRRYSGAGPADRWGSDDERGYTSGLPRPTSVPAEVLAEARATVQFRYFIGWTTPDHEITAEGTRA
jgi:hypothetical protein